MTTYRINDRVIVTQDTETGARTFMGTVVNAWPAGNQLTYSVRPDGVSSRHPDVQATADQMSLLDEEPATTGTGNPTSRWAVLAPWTWTHLKPWEFVAMMFTIYGLPPMLAVVIVAMVTGVRP